MVELVPETSNNSIFWQVLQVSKIHHGYGLYYYDNSYDNEKPTASEPGSRRRSAPLALSRFPPEAANWAARTRFGMGRLLPSGKLT